MNGPAFLGARLTFGRHEGFLDLESPSGLTIVTGANGAGKTTLVEGLLRTIYGFQRRQPADRVVRTARWPWGERAFTSTVRLRTANGDLLEWHRDFDSDEVVVRDAGGPERFRGTVKPGGSSAAERAYLSLVEEIFGLTDLASYARTAWLEQGRALDTRFDADLLRLVDGGHARVLEALDRVKVAHRNLTREAIADGERRAARDGALERAEARRGEIRAELARVRAASAELRAQRDRLAEVDARIGALVETLETLERERREGLELRRIRAELAEARLRLDQITVARSEYADARREVDVAEAEVERLGRTSSYPSDFVERTLELQSIWAEREGLDAEEAKPATPPHYAWRDVLSVVAAAAFFAGGALGVRNSEAYGWPMLAGGLALAVHAVISALDRRTSRRHATLRSTDQAARRGDLDTRLERLLDGVPGGSSLGPANVGERRAAFERSRAAEVRLDVARRAFRDAARRVESVGAMMDTPGRSLDLLEADAERMARDKQQELAAVEERSGRVEARPEIGPAELVERIGAAEDELHDLQAERDRLLVSVDRAHRSAVDLPRLMRDLSEAERKADEARLAARSCRAAWALLRDGYEEYREQDEGRLVASVARQLERLSAGRLGGFVSADGLGSPTVELDGTPVELNSPHLSYGQRHVVMLAVRLGTADFLAASGPAVPLVIDEPFAHLDDAHAGLVMRLLASVAEERQVLITTQDEALLARLGVQPTLRLSERSGPSAASSGDRRSEPLNASEATRV